MTIKTVVLAAAIAATLAGIGTASAAQTAAKTYVFRQPVKGLTGPVCSTAPITLIDPDDSWPVAPKSPVVEVSPACKSVHFVLHGFQSVQSVQDPRPAGCGVVVAAGETGGVVSGTIALRGSAAIAMAHVPAATAFDIVRPGLPCRGGQRLAYSQPDAYLLASLPGSPGSGAWAVVATAAGGAGPAGDLAEQVPTKVTPGPATQFVTYNGNWAADGVLDAQQIAAGAALPIVYQSTGAPQEMPPVPPDGWPYAVLTFSPDPVSGN
jgi:hypothetical protein